MVNKSFDYWVKNSAYASSYKEIILFTIFMIAQLILISLKIDPIIFPISTFASWFYGNIIITEVISLIFLKLWTASRAATAYKIICTECEQLAMIAATNEPKFNDHFEKIVDLPARILINLRNIQPQNYTTEKTKSGETIALLDLIQIFNNMDLDETEKEKIREIYRAINKEISEIVCTTFGNIFPIVEGIINTSVWIWAFFFPWFLWGDYGWFTIIIYIVITWTMFAFVAVLRVVSNPFKFQKEIKQSWYNLDTFSINCQSTIRAILNIKKDISHNVGSIYFSSIKTNK